MMTNYALAISVIALNSGSGTAREYPELPDIFTTRKLVVQNSKAVMLLIEVRREWVLLETVRLERNIRNLPKEAASPFHYRPERFWVHAPTGT
jgi:hypothetical protein